MPVAHKFCITVLCWFQTGCPKFPSLLCNREMRSLSSFLKLEKCSWGPAYWNLDKEHLAGALPSHTVICVLHSTALWESLCLNLAPFVHLKHATVCEWFEGQRWSAGDLGSGNRDAAVLRLLLPGGPAGQVEDVGMCSPYMCPSIPSGGIQTSLNAIMHPGKAEGQACGEDPDEGSKASSDPSADFGPSSRWLLYLKALRSAWFQWELWAVYSFWQYGPLPVCVAVLGAGKQLFSCSYLFSVRSGSLEKHSLSPPQPSRTWAVLKRMGQSSSHRQAEPFKGLELFLVNKSHIKDAVVRNWWWNFYIEKRHGP